MTHLAITFFQDSANEWRWHAQTDNYRVVAASGEGYKNKSDCEEIAHMLFDSELDVTYTTTDASKEN